MLAVFARSRWAGDICAVVNGWVFNFVLGLEKKVWRVRDLILGGRSLYNRILQIGVPRHPSCGGIVGFVFL